jgi:fatty-acyl-CoA synthase
MSHGAGSTLGSAFGAQDEPRRPRGNLSYVSGVTDDPLRFVTVSQALDETVAAHGSRAAAIFSAEREVLSWKDLQRQSEDVSLALMALGIQRGQRVGLWSPNRREWLLVQFGAARIGAVLVNLDPASSVAELSFALNRSQCSVLIAARTVQPTDFLGMLRSLAPEVDRPADKPVLESHGLPHLKHVIVMGEGLVPARVERFSDFLRRAKPGAKRRLTLLAAALDPDDAINIQFTGGTTGVPKAVTLSHFNIVNNARYAARAMQLSDVDKLCIAVPLHLGLGMVLGVLACVATGATMVFPGEFFRADRTLEAVSRHRCTALHGSTDLFEALLAHPNLPDYDTSSLRTGILSGAPCPVDTLQRVVEELCMDELTVAYGMTEAGPVVFQSNVDDPMDVRAETVGRVHPNVEAKLIDRNGHIVPVGARGELCVRGYSVMRGYWEDAQATRDTFDDNGWLHTGDLATMDADGYCRIAGRAADILVRGGSHVPLDDIERLIRKHPKVQDVQVFGVPNAQRGDEVCAWIVLGPGFKAGADEIGSFCSSKLGPESVPRHIRFVADFPVSPNGRVQKFLMRAAMVQELRSREIRSA